MARLPIYRHFVSFGDCDPAGIVFYPNIFRWMDAAFHNGLRGHGGHVEVCKRLDAIGLGLMDASAGFRAPLWDGNVVEIAPEITEWGGRSFTLAYTGAVDGTTAFTGREVRGVFRREGGAVTAGSVEPLRAIFEGQGDG